MGDPELNPAQRRAARKALRQERNRDEILAAARIVLARDGAQAFTLPAVAHQAGVSKPAVYYYFANREALVSALAASLFEEEIAASCAAVEAAADGVSALEAAVRVRVERYADDLDAFRMVYLWPQLVGVDTAMVHSVVIPGARRLNDLLEARLAQDQAAGRLHAEAVPRRLANLSHLISQGILDTVSGMALAGDGTRFTARQLCEEATATLRRACRPG